MRREEIKSGAPKPVMPWPGRVGLMLDEAPTYQVPRIGPGGWGDTVTCVHRGTA